MFALPLRGLIVRRWGGSTSAMGAGAVIVATTVLVTTGVVQPPFQGAHDPGSPPEGGYTTGNLWISEDGGPCTYESTPIEFDASKDCDGFDEAYDAIRTATGSTCGGRVLIKAGTYPDESVTGYRTNCPTTEAGQTLFAPENFDCDLETWPTSNTPVLIDGSIQPGHAENDGQSNQAGHVTFCGLTHLPCNCDNTNASGTVTDNSRHSAFIFGNRYITYKRSILGGFAIFSSDPSVYSGAGNITLMYNLFEEVHEYGTGSNGKVDIAEDVWIEGNFFRNYRSLANCTTGGAVDCGHHEIMFLNGTNEVTIRRNRFFNYEHSAAIYTTCGQSSESGFMINNHNDGYCHRNLLVENNWGESPHNTSPGEQDPGQPSERGEAFMGPGHCEGSSSTDLDNIIIRNNTVVGELAEISLGTGGGGCTIGAGGVHITGNIANKVTSAEGCSWSGLTMDYNIGTIYASGGNNACGANRHNSTLATSILVDPTWGDLDQDAHLLSGSTVAAGFVPEALCPDDDYEGNPRPAGACDAGAFEE